MKISFIIFLCLALPSFTTPYNLAGNIYAVRKSLVIFHSNAPLELIRASSNKLRGLLDIEKRTFAFKIPVSSFHGFNSPLQEVHFNENYMESEKYPDISFEGKIIEDYDLTQNGNYEIRAKGVLNVHGVDQERIIKTSLVIKDKQINAKSKFTVLLADHNIKIPKVVEEKLASEIMVEVEADFVPQN